MVLLVDERPEEVTDWQRTVQAAEVVYSTFDKPAGPAHPGDRARAWSGPSAWPRWGRTSRSSSTRSPGSRARTTSPRRPRARSCRAVIDSTALCTRRSGSSGPPATSRRAARVTIIASALVETGSRMDEVIFEEFKGTGNMELRLDRQLAEKRLFPAINVEASSTRKEELLMPTEELALVVAPPPGASRARAGCRARAAHRQDPGHQVQRAVPAGDREGPGLVSWDRRTARRTPSKHPKTKEAPNMKQGIHPEYVVATVHCSCGNTFTTRSTRSSCAWRSARTATRSTRASRSWSTRAGGSSGSSAATRSSRPSRPRRSKEREASRRSTVHRPPTSPPSPQPAETEQG